MNPNHLRKIKRETIQSDALQDTKEILISFPPGYHEHRPYPALLLHDGDDYFHMGRIVTQANPLMDKGELIPFLIIGIPVNKKRRNQEYSPIGHRQPLHLQFLKEELIPFLTTHYPVDLSPSRWVIGGSSLGGTISFHFALANPDLCQRVLLHSAAFLDETLQQIKQGPALQKMNIYQLIGLNERAVPTNVGEIDFLERNRQAYKLLQEKKAKIKYLEAEGDHTWRLWQKDLPQALQYFFGPNRA